MGTRSSPSTRTAAGLLAYAHASVDFYQGAVAALVPLLVLERGYTYAAAAGIVLASSLASSVVQPMFGALSDRWKMGWLIPVSVFLAGAGIAGVGLNENFWVTAICAAASGIGVAAFHPAGASRARQISGDDHVVMSWFSLGGNVGFAVSPVVVAATVGVLGLGASPLLMIPAVTGLVAYAVSSRGYTSSAAAQRMQQARRSGLDDDWRSFTRMSVAIMCRSIVFVVIGSFIVLFVAQHASIGELGSTASLFVFYAGGMFGTALGGYLARRFARTTILRAAYALAVPAVTGLFLTPGPAVFIFILLVSVLIYVPFSLHVSLGQDYLPRHMGTASGVTLGLAVSVGGLASPAVGALADQIGLQLALLPLIALPLIAALVLIGLKDPLSAASQARPESDGSAAAPRRQP